MTTLLKIARYELSDVIRSRWLVAYFAFFLVTADLLLRFAGVTPRTLLSLANVVLLLVPLVSSLYGTLHLYNARPFIEMLLVQPIERRRIYAGIFGGLAVPLSLGFVLGLSIPFLWHGHFEAALARPLLVLLLSGVLLTGIFVALALVFATAFDEKARGLGTALVCWLLLTLVYDGAVLLALQVLADYPLDRAALGLMMLNPVDLARVLMMMQFDISALMGYTGAVFERFFGSGLGMAAALAAMIVWIAVPYWIGGRIFRRKDF